MDKSVLRVASASNFLMDLLATNPGRIVACNLVDAVEQGVLGPNKARECLKFCGDLYDCKVKGITDSELRYAKTYGLFHRIFESNPALTFQSGQPADDVLHENVCWVTSFWTLKEHYINFSKVSAHFCFAEGSDLTADIMETAIAALSGAEVKAHAYMRGLVETWWHTNLETFDKVVSAVLPEERAGRVRDWLGLIHYKEGSALVAITIPAETVANAVPVKRPTFIEARDHPRFRSWSETVPRDWGRAVDLHALESGTAEATGGEERVASKVPFPSLDKVNACFLGIVANTREAEISDDRFVSLMTRGRNDKDLRLALEKLVASEASDE